MRTLALAAAAALVTGALTTAAPGSAYEMMPLSAKVSQEQLLSTNLARCSGLLQVLGIRAIEAGDYFTDLTSLSVDLGMAAMTALSEENPGMDHAEQAQLAVATAGEYEARYTVVLDQHGDLGPLKGDDTICVATAGHIKAERKR